MPSENFYTEIYDTKVGNVKVRPTSAFIMCDECKHYGGHEVICSQVTVEGLAALLTQARKREQHYRDKAAEWLTQLQRLTGKMAILKNENNKLRAANEKLRKEKGDVK